MHDSAKLYMGINGREKNEEEINIKRDDSGIEFTDSNVFVWMW